MSRILVVGTGVHFESAVSGFRSKIGGFELKKEENQALLYYLHMDNNVRRAEGMLAAGLVELKRMEKVLRQFDLVFLYIDELTEGLNMIPFFAQLQTCRIYVITADYRQSVVYKLLGAHHVIKHYTHSVNHRWLGQLAMDSDSQK
ncbi:MAG: hypothetical protein ACM32O_20810 [Clostridia bacterium]